MKAAIALLAGAAAAAGAIVYFRKKKEGNPMLFSRDFEECPPTEEELAGDIVVDIEEPQADDQ